MVAEFEFLVRGSIMLLLYPEGVLEYAFLSGLGCYFHDLVYYSGPKSSEGSDSEIAHLERETNS